MLDYSPSVEFTTALQMPLDPLPNRIVQRMDAIAAMDAPRWQAIKANTRDAYLALVELYEQAGLLHCADWARVQAGEKRIHYDLVIRHRRTFIPKTERENEVIAIIRAAMPAGITREQLSQQLHICRTTVDNWTRHLRVSGAIVTEGSGSINRIYKLAHPRKENS